MLDWEGYIIPPSQQTRFVLSDVDDDVAMTSSLMISAVENEAIDKLIEIEEEEDIDLSFPLLVPAAVDDVTKHLSSISAIYDDKMLLD